MGDVQGLLDDLYWGHHNLGNILGRSGRQAMRRTTIMTMSRQTSFWLGIRQVLSQGKEPESIEIIDCGLDDDGDNAIYRIADNSPDMVLLDIEYPQLKGLGLGQRIARTFPETRVITLSTNPEDDDEELFKVIRSGAAAYIRSKQPSRTELIETIKRASNGEHPIEDFVTSKPGVARRISKQFRNMISIPGTEGFITSLTTGEAQLLTLIVEGNPLGRIASIMNSSEQIIGNHIGSILYKLNANDKAFDLFTRTRNELLSIRLARDGNLFLLNTPTTSCLHLPMLNNTR